MRPEGTFRFLTLNLWGEKPYDWTGRSPSFETLKIRMNHIRDFLLEARPDVVALQEVVEFEDLTGNQAQFLAESCGYHWIWAPALLKPNGFRQGVALLSREKYLERSVLELPPFERPDLEPRVAIGGRFETHFGPIFCVSTHLHHQAECGVERKLQVQAMMDWPFLKAGRHPRVIMGDFNAEPESPELSLARQSLRDAFVEASPDCKPGGETWSLKNSWVSARSDASRDRRIDYVLYSSQSDAAKLRPIRSEIVLDRPGAEGLYASDHFGVMVDLQVLGHRAYETE